MARNQKYYETLRMRGKPAPNASANPFADIFAPENTSAPIDGEGSTNMLAVPEPKSSRDLDQCFGGKRPITVVPFEEEDGSLGNPEDFPTGIKTGADAMEFTTELTRLKMMQS